MAFDKKFNPDELKQFLKSKYGPGVQGEIFPKAEEDPTDEGGDKAERRSRALRFDYKPSQIKEYLDSYVIEQVDAKKVLATAVCDHYHHIQGCQGEEDCQDYKKQNIILIGPTGVGKTYLIQNIARLIGVPFVKADATKYSETGYVGGDVEDLLTGVSGEVPTAALFSLNITLSGITVGSRRHQEDMIAAIEANCIKPGLDKDFPLSEIAAAFAHQASQQHFGKITLSL